LNILNKYKSFTTAKNVCLMLLVMMCLTGLYFSSVWGVAAIGHDIAMNHFERWLSKQEQPNANLWLTTEDALHLASELDSKNAEYMNDLGRFHEYASRLKDVAPLSPTQHISTAIRYFRTSTQLAPTWGVAWVNLALAKHSLGQIDDEMKEALTYGIQWGSNVPYQQLTMAEVSIARWRYFDAELRKLLLKNIKQVLRSNERLKLMDIIEHYQMKPYFCLKVNGLNQELLCQ